MIFIPIDCTLSLNFKWWNIFFFYQTSRFWLILAIVELRMKRKILYLKDPKDSISPHGSSVVVCEQKVNWLCENYTAVTFTFFVQMPVHHITPFECFNSQWQPKMVIYCSETIETIAAFHSSVVTGKRCKNIKFCFNCWNEIKKIWKSASKQLIPVLDSPFKWKTQKTKTTNWITTLKYKMAKTWRIRRNAAAKILE